MSSVAVIAIGRNEGERLRACLTSAVRDADTVVYVDSGSTDGSVALARELGCRVVELDLSKPFTAARARNEGAAAAGEVEYLQFVDGDCEIVEGWIGKAVAFLEANPQASVVCGRRRERYPDATKWNKLCDMEWDTPIGKAEACGGDAMIRRSAFEQVGGYNPAVIAGEEPEMCVRLRAAGHEIHRIDEEMTLHDAAMTKFSQWWKRNVRAGHAFAEGYDRHPPFRKKQVRSNYAFGCFSFALYVCGLAIALIGAWIATGQVARWASVAVGLTFVAGVAGLWVRLLRRVKEHRLSNGDASKDASMYATYVLRSKLPQALGQLKYRLNKLRGKQATIIEYKGASE
ncbi:MAG: glycosyltransferase family 2 protein [Planctomycetota bacterium]